MLLDAAVSDEDKARLADLLGRARVASASANQTLDDVSAANADLAAFDRTHEETKDLLTETTEVVNDGWSDVNKVGCRNNQSELFI